MNTFHTTFPFGKRIVLRQGLLVALASIFSCCTGNAQGGAENTVPAEPQEHQVTLIFGGDLMQHEPQIKAARTANGTYDYSDVFDYMAPEIQRADIAIANFEVRPSIQRLPAVLCP